MSEALHDRIVAAVGDQYELQGEIGRGGMSVVYHAIDRRLHRAVALKVLPPELAYDAAIRTRFTREAQTAAQLGHAHIVPIYDVGERDGVAYLVMALISGGNLGTHLMREPRLPIDETRRLVSEIADALAYAHLRGVIHRDIKPDNILLDGDSGRALVTDFGIARAMEAGTRLTVTGIAVGTPTYMSPEQAVGERELDGRSDIYSLGVLAYQMLTGRVPFRASNSMALLMKHVTERPRSIAELRPEVPRAMREAIERALEKAPEDRWPTATTFRDALEGESVTPPWRAHRAESPRGTGTRPDPVRVDSSRGDSLRSGHARLDWANDSGRRPARGADAKPSRRDAARDPGREKPAVVMVPEHLAVLTPEQRRDIRLWHGRIDLLDRVKAYRGYLLSTVFMFGASMVAFAGGVEEGIPPLVLAPIVPLWMSRKLWLRGRSLREAGLKLRRAWLMPRAKWVIPKPAASPTQQQLLKIASLELLDGPYGNHIRRAAEDRASILDTVKRLPKPDRALLPDVEPTVNALVERVTSLAQMLHRLDQSIDADLVAQLDARIVTAEREGQSPEGQRRLALLRRQRSTLEELMQRRATLTRQIDSAGLALGNLRLDLIKLRSSGLQAALGDLSSATQEAKALSREIGMVLDAAAEVKAL